MPTDKPTPITQAPDIFSRGSLAHTFDLVRKKDPLLALNVRNITGGIPLPKSEVQPDNKHTDFFKVELDSFQVRAIVEALMEYGQGGNNDSGAAVVARTLMEDWMRLAHKMISELPNTDNP